MSEEGTPQRKLSARPRRALIRSRRRLTAAVVLATPLLLQLGLDLSRRSSHMLTFAPLHALGYAGSVALTGTFWAALLLAATRRRGRARVFFALGLFLLFPLQLAVQSAFFRMYNVYCGSDAMLEYRAIPSTWTCALPWDRRTQLGLYLPAAFVLALALAYATRTFARPRPALRRSAGLAAFVLGAFLFAGPASYRVWQSSSPDHIYLSAMGVAVREQFPPSRRLKVLRTQRRTPTVIPPLSAASDRRNVVLVLQESLREDVYCSDPSPTCARPGRHSHEVAKPRFPFNGMRAVASSTVISMSVILSGLPPTEDFATLHSAPYLFGFAKAAWYSTAYYTSQYIMLFGMRFLVQDEGLDELVMSSHLHMGADGDTGANDSLLADRVVAELPKLKEPFFAVVQLSNPHFPYLVDEADAPYAPEAADKRKEAFARYQNAVHASDKAFARVMTAIAASPSTDRTIVVFTSDHGESFWEHGGDGHTKTVYETEVRVPAWIWAKRGVLSQPEREGLRAARSTPTYHLDLAPTILDLMGLWDLPAVAPHRAKMPGQPLTRPLGPREPVALTNCSWIWQCKNASLGMMHYPHKLAARGKDDQYACFNLETDPKEKKDLGEAACGDLAARARALFGYMPADVTPNENPPR
ncbi:MAG: sulfatase-like hydrolase/transferase [Polyangiaceae bacterium]|nr:sulfatase-like hydrolase/transferase [Polyangiaceae bacterium]